MRESRVVGQRSAMSVREFCTRFSVGRTTAYQEIRAKRLKARKCGDRAIIADSDAEEWLRCLPVFGAGMQNARKRKRVP
jgi:excisionase family DNA binding protein